jgi:hypothetical protein
MGDIENGYALFNHQALKQGRNLGLIVTSRAVVGSSAITKSGPGRRAIAIMMRCL